MISSALDDQGHDPLDDRRAEGWMVAAHCLFCRQCGEESPDSLRQRCRVMPGQSNLTESATEMKPPLAGKGETVG